jgi:hypothetical protein
LGLSQTGLFFANHLKTGDGYDKAISLLSPPYRILTGISQSWSEGWVLKDREVLRRGIGFPR